MNVTMEKKIERITTVLLLAFIMWEAPRRFVPNLKSLECIGGLLAAIALYMCLTLIFKGGRGKRLIFYTVVSAFFVMAVIMDLLF